MSDLVARLDALSLSNMIDHDRSAYWLAKMMHTVLLIQHGSVDSNSPFVYDRLDNAMKHLETVNESLRPKPTIKMNLIEPKPTDPYTEIGIRNENYGGK